MVVWGVVSGKGGVGKTTVTSNLATALSLVFYRDAIILDCNTTSSHLRMHFGLYEKVEKTLPEVLKSKSKLTEVAYEHERTGVKIVPAGFGLERAKMEKLKGLVWEMAKSKEEFVLMDAPPGFGEDVVNIIKTSEQVLIVTNPFIPDVLDALKILELSRKFKKKTEIIVNKYKGRKSEIGVNAIESVLDKKIKFIVPEDIKIGESITAGLPVVAYAPLSKSARAFKKIAGSLIGESYRVGVGEVIKALLSL